MRRLDLDMLRTLAISLVLGYHFSIPGFEYGYLGVDLFFVLSGYLIWGILTKKETSPIDFLLRRIHRIYPAMMVVLGITTLVSLCMRPELVDTNLQQVIWTLLSIQNVYFFQRSGYFEPSADTFLFLHLWSLAIEIQFYLLCALSLFLVNNFRVLWFLFTVAAIISLILCIYYGQLYTNANFYLLPTRLWEFYLGALAFKFYHSVIMPNKCKPIKSIVFIICTAVPFILSYMDLEYIHHPGFTTLILCILAATFCALKDYPKQNTAVSCYAKITFSTYLVHWPILRLANFDHFFFSLVASLVGGAILFHTIEKFPSLVRSFYLSITLLIIIIMATPLASAIAQQLYDDDKLHVLQYNHKKEAQRLSSNFQNASIRASMNLENDILVIGDSYAMDVFNALQRVAPNVSYGTFHLSSACGVLWDLEDYKSNWLSKDEKVCQHMGDLKSIDWQRRSVRAIFLASRWQTWQIPFLSETLQRLPKDVPIYLFGSKEFQNQNFRMLATGEIDDLRFKYDNKIFQINSDIQRISDRYENVTYVNTMQPFCENEQCTNFDMELNNIYSYDGYHLTETGTAILANHLLPLLHWIEN